MTKRSTLVLLWTLAVLGVVVGTFLVVLGTVGDDVTRAQAGVIVGLGLVVLAGAGWQLTRLVRYGRAADEFTAARSELTQALDAVAPGCEDRALGGRTDQAPVHGAAPPGQSGRASGGEVRSWHLAVAWFVAAVIAVIGCLFLAGGLVGLLDRSNAVAGTLLAVVGLLILWGDATYAHGILRSHRRGSGPGDGAGRPDAG